MHRIFRGFFITLLLSLTLFSVQAQEWYEGKPIREIQFEGLRSVAKSEMDGVVRPYLEKPFSNDLWRELQAKLYALDYFTGLINPSAEPMDESARFVRIIFTVKEKPQINDIVFIGNRRISSSDLQAKTNIKKEELINYTKIRSDERELVLLYQERGFLDIKIESRVETDPDEEKNQVTVYFDISEGIQTAVKTISFTGLSFANSSNLKDRMETKEQGFLNNGLFKEDTFRKDLLTVQQYYWDRGYIDAKVVDVNRETVFDTENERNVLNITLTLSEGQQFVYGGVIFEGNIVFNETELLAQVRHNKGDVVSKQLIDRDYERIVDLYYENGYIFNQIQREEIREGQIISYKIKVQERSRAHIENIFIRGNTKTQSDVILREIPLEEGDVFSKSKFVEGLRNLYNLQYFEVVEPETPQGSAPDLMNLVLNVSEGQTANILFAMSFSGSQEFPISGQLKWQDRNFNGTGQTLGLQGEVSLFNQSVSLNYSNPWFLDNRITLGGSIGWSHNVNFGIEQDILAPFYDLENIPDPYSKDVYVYPDGSPFNQIPTSDQISQLGLITEYEYDARNNTLKTSQNLMNYDAHEFSMGLNTGYLHFTPFGRLRYSASGKTSLQYITYDQSQFRPASLALRENLDVWQFENVLSFGAAFDSRDFYFNPTSGFYWGNFVSVAGGFLSGKTHYTRYDTRAEWYQTLVNTMIGEEFNFKLIFKAKSAMSFLMNPIGNDGIRVTQPKDELYIDGMTNGRGWGQVAGGESTWFNNLELRMPIIPELLWMDLFLESALLLKPIDTYDSIFSVSLASQKFSWGFGFRFVNPQFPIGVYFTKPFSIDSSGNTNWIKGDGIFGDFVDFKFVIAFAMEM